MLLMVVGRYPVPGVRFVEICEPRMVSHCLAFIVLPEYDSRCPELSLRWSASGRS